MKLKIYLQQICILLFLAAGAINSFAQCVAPSVPTITTTNQTACQGTLATLSIVSGNLNSATAWKWYRTSCGGTLVGQGTSVVVNAVGNTTYFVRGEGGCVGAAGACASIT